MIFSYSEISIDDIILMDSQKKGFSMMSVKDFKRGVINFFIGWSKVQHILVNVNVCYDQSFQRFRTCSGWDSHE